MYLSLLSYPSLRLVRNESLLTRTKQKIHASAFFLFLFRSDTQTLACRFSTLLCPAHRILFCSYTFHDRELYYVSFYACTFQRLAGRILVADYVYTERQPAGVDKSRNDIQSQVFQKCNCGVSWSSSQVPNKHYVIVACRLTEFSHAVIPVSPILGRASSTAFPACQSIQ